MVRVSTSEATHAAQKTGNLNVTEVTRITQGSNESFCIQTPQEKYAIKFNTFSLYETFMAEVDVLRALKAETSLPIPTIIAVEKNTKQTIPPHFISRWIQSEGIPQPLIEQYDSKIVQQMGQIIRELSFPQSRDINGYGRIRRIESNGTLKIDTSHTTWRDYYQNYVDDVLDAATQTTPDVFKPFITPLRTEIHSCIESVPEEPNPAIVLPDFRLENLLAREKTVVGVLDFERADLGDAHLTLTNTDYLLGRGLSETEQVRLTSDLTEGFGGWVPSQKHRVYRLGAIAKELRAFDHWWKHCSDNQYGEHVERFTRTLQETLR